MIEFFGIDDDAVFGQRHGATGQASPATPGNDVQFQGGDGLQQGGDLLFSGRSRHGHGQAEAPVGGVGGMADQGKGI